MIQVNGLIKDYGARRALNAISFNANQGEIVGFLGPNGAGKTTTMRILTGYMPPTEGEVTVAGYDVVEDSLEVRKRVGYLPETVPLYNDMSALDYLKFMADLRHVPDAEERAAEALESVNLGERANSFIGSFSKGMRQRVGLAQALLHRPEVIILDEPTIGLDPSQVVEIRELIRAIGKDRTVLFSTHILSEAQQICDRVLIINKGKIVAEDTPENLQARLTGAQRIILRVRGESDDLPAKIKKIKGVQDVEAKSDGSIEFEFASGQDSRPQVARAVVQEGYDLLEFRPVGMSLEEIFLELTRDTSSGKKSS
ncbi:MAG TPA: ATP-binding cassette domain-containing protein [Anaerolineales bacterium]|nr:ATP-binding cassette domain-containing protein [Anaerolineales bacterium]MCC6567709.1 ATP-binding cassette domain-containing protein [Anaerolineales bacterium]HMR98159.1 ATP-binding cassette domain-containing protein [Anaerolineales bacterium]HNQ94031.1 ATP-binding cassette domain-containing protein [Anaerolineales bacterium]HNS60573.1 ATP-binding cassette domain-containing protein [Anaerolineales bacterium]